MWHNFPELKDFQAKLMVFIYTSRFNGQRIVATKALDDLHWRAAHSLLAPAHMVRGDLHLKILKYVIGV